MSDFLRLALFAAGSALLVTACGDDAAQGELSLSVTDAPVDEVASVVVTFTGVELQPQGGDRIDFTYDAPRQIDLLALQGGLSSSLLEGVMVPAGGYAWIRLKLAADGTTESFVQEMDGSIHALRIPSGAETGLKLHGGVAVAAGGVSSFTVDFDLRKSLHAPQGGSSDYLLRPTLRLVDDLVVGSITGTVDPLLLTEGCSPAVYAFAGSVPPANFDDVDGVDPEPIASAMVVTDPETEVSSYTVGFLAAGTYTVAFTCQASADLPDSSEAIAFTASAEGAVVAGSATTIDLHP